MRRLQLLRHPIVKNVLALSWVQFATFVIPLVTLPYLARVLSPSGFGLVVFSQGFSFVLGLVIQYGFDQFSTREVAAARDDPAALEMAVHRVMSAKAMLVAGASVVAAGAYFVVPTLRDHPDLLLLAWTAAVANGLVPGWYFVGLERVRLVSLLQLVVRGIAAGLTFVLVTGRGDAWVVMALYAGGSVLVCLITTTMLYRRVSVRRPVPSVGREAIRDAWPLFVTAGSVTLYTSLNVVLLGFFASSAEVAHFGAAERVVRAALLVFNPVGVAIYPRLVHLQSSNDPHRAWRLLRTMSLLVGVASVLVFVGLVVAAPLAIRLVYGPGFEEAEAALRLLALIIPLNVATSVAGAWLLSLKKDRLVSSIVIRVGLLNLALALVLAPTLGVDGMVLSVVAAEVAATVLCLVALRRLAPSRAAR